MSQVLITGGCGFIGHHLVNACVNEHDEVTVLDNLSNGKGRRLPKNVCFIEGDIRDTGLLKKLIKDKEIIFHLAAVTSVAMTMTEWTQSNSINLGGTVSIFDIASLAKHPPIVIYTSSAAVYGNTDQKNFETGKVQPINPYGLDKLSCEKQATMFSDMRELKTIGLRVFNVYGKDQSADNRYSGVINIFNQQIRSGKNLVIYGDGKQSRDFIYISDLIRILLTLKDRAQMCLPIINAATGKSVSILRLAKTIKEITNSNAKIIFENARIGDIRHSRADITLLRNVFPEFKGIDLKEGLKILIEK